MNRAFTTAPQSQAAVDMAHRFARQRLELGAPAGLKRKRTAVRAGATEFVLPLDIEPLAFARALGQSWTTATPMTRCIRLNKRS